MKKVSTSRRVSGFTVIDILVMVGVVALLLSWAYYALMPRGCKGRSPRITCVSNLRQVGLAFRMWSNDHREQFPWQVSVTNGGTLEYATSAAVFRHFQAASNELNSPKILVCPADEKRQRTPSFETNFSNLNISYFIGLDSNETAPMSILSGDRNLTTNGVPLKGYTLLPTNSLTRWSRDIHDGHGDIGLADGSAMQIDDALLQRQLAVASNRIVRLAIP